VNRILSSKWTKVALFILCLIPLAILLWRVYQVWRFSTQDLTANPIEYITHYTGDWTIRFIMITLTVTPLRVIFNRPQITRFRRMMGLYAFFYGSLHLTTWLTLGPGALSFSGMIDDVIKRKFITIGMLAFLSMLPLAITSTAGWVRRLGFKRWQKLHRLVYLAGIAAVIHYYWLVKSDVRLPLMYGAILAILLGFRVVVNMRKPKAPAKRAPQPSVQTQ